MSRERQKARAAREVARQVEVEQAARKRQRATRRQAVVPKLPARTRRRRYGALPARVRYQVVVSFLVVQAVGWYFLPGSGARLSLAVLTAACLAVLVITRRSY